MSSDNADEKTKLNQEEGGEQGTENKTGAEGAQNPENNNNNNVAEQNNNQPQGGESSGAPAEKKEEGGINLTFGRFMIAGLFECFGTFLFITAILLGSGPEATIMSFWIIITMISPFSGGHVNPAVTFACYIYDMKLCAGLPKLIMYWLAQIGGGTLALMFAVEIKEKVEIIIFKHAVEYPEFMTEFFFTGTFIFVILYCCSETTQVSKNRALNCVIISTWLYYAATSAGKRSVGALNPAVLSVFAIYNAHVKDDYYKQHKKDIWMTLLAHFGSALAFAILFFLAETMFPDPPKDEKKDAKEGEKVENKKDEKVNNV